MRKAKYLTYTILIVLAMILIGELYTWNLESFFNDYSRTTFYKQKNISTDTMMSDIEKAAENNDVTVFTYDNKPSDSLGYTTYLYGTKGFEKVLETRSQVKEGSFDSLFLGNHVIRFKNIAEIKDAADITDYYLEGSNNDLDNFKAQLINKYGGNFPQDASRSSDGTLSVLAIWLVVFILILLLTCYEIALKKKEIVVRMISGDRIWRMIGHSIAADCIVYVAVGITAWIILCRFTTVEYNQTITFIAFTGFLILDALLYFNVLRVDFKKDIKTNRTVKSVLAVSYVYKVISMVLVVVLMAGNITLIMSGIDCYQQKDFFEKHRDYSYIELGMNRKQGNRNSAPEIMDKILAQFYSDMQFKGKAAQTLILRGESGACCFMDSGMKEYLRGIIPELKEKRIEEKVYFLLPKGSEKKDLRQCKKLFEIEYSGKYDYELIYYDKAKMIAMDGDKQGYYGKQVKNIPVIFNNLEYNWRRSSSDLIYENYGTMYKVSDGEWRSFLQKEEKNISVKSSTKTNVYKVYLNHWRVQKRELTMGVALFALLLLIDVFILRAIINYEYVVNAREIILKKTVGYSFLKRYKKIFVSLLSSSAIGMIMVIVIECLWTKNPDPSSVMGCIILIALEALITGIYTARVEKSKIQKILKGGTI